MENHDPSNDLNGTLPAAEAFDTKYQHDSYHVGTLVYTKGTLAKLFFWLLWGDMCFMLMENVVPSILPVRFQQLHATNVTIGLIMSTLPNLINAVCNPIISFRSDRHRGRFGRRIPFIISTLPLLVLSLIGMGFADPISRWISAHFGLLLKTTPLNLEIVTLGVFMVAFSFFNSFVGSVFWYLFNDVVPEHLLARFMSLFRLVSLATVSGYNFFIFKYAGTHSTEILVGASLLYFFGFGLMCLMVKEGKYPPVPPYVDGRTDIVSAVMTFAKECLTLPHYWYIFLISMFGSLAGAAGVFQLFFYESTGMNLAHIGYIAGILNIAVAVLIPISGWLADRFHPLRIVIAGYLMNLFITLPATLIWLAWHPNAHIAYFVWVGISVALIAPATALMGVYDPPVFMVVFPRSRYGQFCSANAMLRSLAGIAGGVVAGGFFDYAAHFVKHDVAYRLMPFWQILFTIPALICALLLYRSWKSYGGDDDYVPPVPGERIGHVLVGEVPEAALPGASH